MAGFVRSWQLRRVRYHVDFVCVREHGLLDGLAVRQDQLAHAQNFLVVPGSLLVLLRTRFVPGSVVVYHVGNDEIWIEGACNIWKIEVYRANPEYGPTAAYPVFPQNVSYIVKVALSLRKGLRCQAIGATLPLAVIDERVVLDFFGVLQAQKPRHGLGKHQVALADFSFLAQIQERVQSCSLDRRIKMDDLVDLGRRGQVLDDHVLPSAI